MMNNINLIPIITALFGLIGAVITYYVIPVLKGRISAEQWSEIVKWVKIAVAAAEQMKAAGIITVPKKDYVLSFLKGKGITITDEELDALIEAEVFEINKAKNLKDKNLDLQEVIVND